MGAYLALHQQKSTFPHLDKLLVLYASTYFNSLQLYKVYATLLQDVVFVSSQPCGLKCKCSLLACSQSGSKWLLRILHCFMPGPSGRLQLALSPSSCRIICHLFYWYKLHISRSPFISRTCLHFGGYAHWHRANPVHHHLEKESCKRLTKTHLNRWDIGMHCSCILGRDGHPSAE